MKKGYLISAVIGLLLVMSMLHRREIKDVIALVIIGAVVTVIYRMRQSNASDDNMATVEEIKTDPVTDEALDVCEDTECHIQPVQGTVEDMKPPVKRDRLQVLMDLDNTIVVEPNGEIWMIYLGCHLKAELTEEDFRYIFDRNAEENEWCRKRRLAAKYFGKDILAIFDNIATEAGYRPCET